MTTLLAAFSTTACGRRAPDVPLPDTERPLALLDRPTLAGPPVDLATLAGKVVVVNVWSPSCAPCMHEAPGLQRLADELAPRGLALVTVMMEGTRAEAEAFVKRAGLTAPVVLGDAELAGHLRLLAYPWTVVIGRDGKPATVVRGSREPGEFRAIFDRAL
jgi:thiol-disulfide isomerase/thioredoxin